jgi:AcrR family transcriptional regulator
MNPGEAIMTPVSGMDETKRRIIQAALKLFGEVGYPRATTRAIAERAGINEVTLFRHFGSKKNLLIECVSSGNQAGFAQTFQDHLTGEYAADIRAMARLQMADTQRNFEILRLLLCDAHALSDLQEAMTGSAAQNRERLADYFRQQIAAGIVRAELHPLVLAHAFDSLFSSYTFFEQLLGTAPLTTIAADDVVESLASLFIQGTRVK